MKAVVRLIAEYEIEYQSPEGRHEALEAALGGGVDVRGAGPGGLYRATRLSLTVAGGTDAARCLDLPIEETLG